MENINEIKKEREQVPEFMYIQRLEDYCHQLEKEAEHILGEIRWYAGKDNFYTIQQSLKEFREGGQQNERNSKV